ncbi:coiled-coil domain-containing protein 22 homolog [Anopheles albimanus]|uniref:coiled-coil domain-containing protein 22 homolog n=1 Tax=Anopheles albimanus TaxID=7167 RepID=UPI00164183D9|nr:coiled-coil domain-containing protein 22 homolog [Anopheles albimanus]XP_035788620.1 coiled-coil domain-containing protein 22 homolog [Anopheles albimanus]
MDDIDNIILHSLRQIDSDLDEDIQGLDQLTPSVLVRAVSKCLLLIDPSLDLPTSLPPGMAQRFTATARLAEACTTVGYRRDIGYQTFLYSNVAEVRRVFMFLIEQLPKESGDTATDELPFDRVTELETRILDTMRQQLQSSWSQRGALDLRQRGTLRGPRRLPFVTQSDVTAEIKEYWLRRSGLWEEDFDEVDRRLPIQDQTVTNSVDAIAKLQAYYAQNKAKSPILNDDEQEREIGSDSNKTTNQLALIEEEMQQLRSSLAEIQSEGQALRAKREAIDQETKSIEQVVERLKEEKKVKERTHILLENPEVNIAKLEAIIVAAGEKMKKLQSQWETHQAPLLAKLEEHRGRSSDSESKLQKMQQEIESVRHKSEEVIVDLQTKSALHARLVQQYERIGKTVSRTAYTGRILEIIGNIRKQKTDIDKILHDTRRLQKEINATTGQLDRQFAVTDDLIFRNARRDEFTKRAYILLVALHTECAELVAMVQETGTFKREVRELEDQIESEKDRNVAANLIQIERDLEEMQRESRRLEEALRQFEITGRNGC